MQDLDFILVAILSLFITIPSLPLMPLDRIREEIDTRLRQDWAELKGFLLLEEAEVTVGMHMCVSRLSPILDKPAETRDQR